jgi:hypothetical protein
MLSLAVLGPEEGHYMPTVKKIIAPSLLDATNHALLLIDQQRSQLLSACSRDLTSVVNATTLIAKGAKLFGVRTLSRLCSRSDGH